MNYIGFSFSVTLSRKYKIRNEDKPTGRKLSQATTFGTALKQTDYVGEFTYEMTHFSSSTTKKEGS